MTEFRSVFKEDIASFLQIREASMSCSGIKHDICYLSSFDTYLADLGLREKVITESTVTGWIKTLTGKTSSRANMIIVIRIFIKYIQALGVPAYTPVIPKVRDDYIPYIFSDDELDRVFAAADNIRITKTQPNPYMKVEFPMILRLLYGCGLRIGETLALQMKDVDLDGGILTLLHTKNEKQRFVPMGQSLTEIMRCYCLAMGVIGKPNAFLFPGTDPSIPMTVRSARNKFDVILKNLGIKATNRNRHERGPCIHCFRHVFVFRSFIKAQRDGRSIDDCIPFLSIYLGHDSLYEIRIEA